MKKTAYHCSNNPSGILKDGYVKPARMKSVYLFEDIKDARWYLYEFDYRAIFEVEFEPHQVLRRWNTKYGRVTRLKEKERVPAKKLFFRPHLKNK